VTFRQPTLDDFAFAAIVMHSLYPATWNVICVRERHINNIVPLFENGIRAYHSRTSERESKTLFGGFCKCKLTLNTAVLLLISITALAVILILINFER
jgi:hypothetical protein